VAGIAADEIIDGLGDRRDHRCRRRPPTATAPGAQDRGHRRCSTWPTRPCVASRVEHPTSAPGFDVWVGGGCPPIHARAAAGRLVRLEEVPTLGGRRRGVP
jgi:hypothetical protein